MIQRGAATGFPAAEADTGTPEAMPFWIDWSTRAGPTTTATAPIVIWASTITTRLYATRSIAGGRPGVFAVFQAVQPISPATMNPSSRCVRWRSTSPPLPNGASWPLQSGKPVQTQPAPSARVSPPTTSRR